MSQDPARWNWTRLVAVTVAAGLVAAGLAFWQIVDLWHAAALAAVVVAATALWSRTGPVVEDPGWPRVPTTARAGGRHDVSDLSWSTFGRDGRVTDRVVRRVRALAADRLRAHGVDPSDPAAKAEVERLLGARVVAQLASRESPTARTLQTWLDAVERLGPAPATRAARPAAHPDRKPGLALTEGPDTDPATTTPEENRA
ncbi:hypothetical protein [Promicromonospora sukumoe]|uniref:hypothetical protein n=1 Tax=Promicromonospora sukumoe TaxID=88382 RepID=UPI00037DED23|nr:hypothetical protein [Promicromonospora sukumoe]